MENAIRDYFNSQSFLEVRTPVLVESPGMEIHIRPVKTSGAAYLQTSPEFAMKKLLAGGLEKIYQICPCFRDEPSSTTHHKEFMMLEWYRAHSSLENIMDDVEGLMEYLAMATQGTTRITYQDRTLDFSRPWSRFKIDDLFLKMTGIDLGDCTSVEDLQSACKKLKVFTQSSDWDDLFFALWLNTIEPNLPSDRPCIVWGYPPSQAALAKTKAFPNGNIRALRFEVYAGGLELGNAFQELTHAQEQRRRFEEDMKKRAEIYGPDFGPTPIDESFIAALEQGLPDPSGIAMGVDRMVMLYANEPDIQKTIWLPSF